MVDAMNAMTAINRDAVIDYAMTAKHTDTTIDYKNAMTAEHTDTTIDYKNAMTAKHTDIIIDYINAMTMAKTLRARSLITKKEYIAFEEMTREKYGLSKGSIYRPFSLLCTPIKR